MTLNFRQINEESKNRMIDSNPNYQIIVLLFFCESAISLSKDNLIFSYRHAADGLIRTFREEGFRKLFNGIEWASSRAVLVTVGQLCFYDVIKQMLLNTKYFKDNLVTHFSSSLCAVSIEKIGFQRINLDL